MDQKKTGQFIAILRKEKNLTQKQLAEMLHITDKAVSKWECGRSLPDNQLLKELCSVLDITINELLSGERLSSDAYNEKAEENIGMLIDEKSANYRKFFIIRAMICIFLFVFCIWIVKRVFPEFMSSRSYMNAVALAIVIILPLIMLVLARRFEGMMKLLKLNFIGVQDENEAQDAVKSATFAIKAVLSSGAFSTMVHLINWISDYNNYGYFGPNLALPFMGVFYSLIISMVLLIFRERIS